MSESLTIVEAGSFCWNEACPEFGRVGAGNLQRYGRTRKGVQRWVCKRCKKVFSATRGTPFHGVHDAEKMLLALSLLGDRMSLRALQRATGVKPDTVLVWMEKAAAHVELIECLLQQRHQLTRAQLDALWTYVGHKGEKGGAQKRRHAAPSGAPV
jgi:transposase-like protein